MTSFSPGGLFQIVHALRWQAGSTSALALQLAHPLMGAPQDLQQCTPLSIIASSLEPTSLTNVCKCVLMANLHDQAAQRPPRLPLLSLLSLWLKKPARQSPGVCHMGPFLCPPFILAFPFYPRRGMKQCWLIQVSSFCPTNWEHFVK